MPPDPQPPAPAPRRRVFITVAEVSGDRHAAQFIRSLRQLDPRVIIDATQKMQAYQVSIGTLDKEVPLDGLFEPRFFERATAR